MKNASFSSLGQLGKLQKALFDLVSSFDENDYRAQFHPDLSPPGWHLGHTVFIENLWIREIILKRGSFPSQQYDLYLPQNMGRSLRGKHLPPKEVLLKSCLAMQRDNLELLADPPASLATHRMMRNDYLKKFLAQHHAIHLETLHMCLTERQLRKETRYFYSPKKCLAAKKPELNLIAFAAGEFEIGTSDTCCFDNELPRHRKSLPAFALSITPVSNAEFLGFMENDGYSNLAWWLPQGQKWLQKSKARAPHHWLQNSEGSWFGTGSRGYHDLEEAAPVYGLNRHEAYAFARYAKARLPHESEWEVAHEHLFPHCNRLEPTCRTWEWCDNGFYPYPGFKPYPYNEYSAQWFNGEYYSLRGHSQYTDEVLQRPTLRNFYTGDKRHIFAGVRLAAL